MLSDFGTWRDRTPPPSVTSSASLWCAPFPFPCTPFPFPIASPFALPLALASVLFTAAPSPFASPSTCTSMLCISIPSSSHARSPAAALAFPGFPASKSVNSSSEATKPGSDLVSTTYRMVLDTKKRKKKNEYATAHGSIPNAALKSPSLMINSARTPPLRSAKHHNAPSAAEAASFLLALPANLSVAIVSSRQAARRQSARP
mmetsp:Transcript_23130/g.54971  ORF Transcript_23130/g.54971 Transcript_23130/m.54971 type:complete len:203 (-) Transcript_23130:23-631(-)